MRIRKYHKYLKESISIPDFDLADVSSDYNSLWKSFVKYDSEKIGRVFFLDILDRGCEMRGYFSYVRYDNKDISEWTEEMFNSNLFSVFYSLTIYKGFDSTIQNHVIDDQDTRSLSDLTDRFTECLNLSNSINDSQKKLSKVFKDVIVNASYDVFSANDQIQYRFNFKMPLTDNQVAEIRKVYEVGFVKELKERIDTQMAKIHNKLKKMGMLVVRIDHMPFDEYDDITDETIPVGIHIDEDIMQVGLYSIETNSIYETIELSKVVEEYMKSVDYDDDKKKGYK